MAPGKIRMAQDAEFHRPQQVTDVLGDRGLGVHHRDIHVAGRRTHAIGADQVDLDVGIGAAEIAQRRYRQARRKARRHLHVQGAQGRRAGVADFIQRVFQPVERLDDRG